MFEAFPKMQRFSHGWTVTEKLDGTNAQIIIASNEDIRLTDDMRFQDTRDGLIKVVGNMYVFAGSRTKLITPGKQTDNYGFAQYVHDNAEAIVETLGEGRHFGEWFGAGIQRRYDMDRKEFALFNVHRWSGVELPDRMRVVPILMDNQYLDQPGKAFAEIMDGLKIGGSHANAGFMNPEGIVIRHNPSGTMFKKTFDYDEFGKWAENQARKAQA